MKYGIDRRTLPYDAFVADPSWLMPYEEEKDKVNDEKTKEVKDKEQVKTEEN